MENNNVKNNFGARYNFNQWQHQDAARTGVLPYFDPRIHPGFGATPTTFNLEPPVWNAQWPLPFPNFHHLTPPPLSLPGPPSHPFGHCPPVPMTYSSDHAMVGFARRSYAPDTEPNSSESWRNSSYEDVLISVKPQDLPKSQREKDQEWLNSFVHHFNEDGNRKPLDSRLNISEAKESFRKCLVLISTLKALHFKLMSGLVYDNSSWDILAKEAATTKLQLQRALEQLSPKRMDDLKVKLQARTNKRLRERNIRELRVQNKLKQKKKTEFLHEKINVWHESIKQAHLAAKMEKTMKIEADSVLGEVRRKRSEATKMLELVRAILKLRAVKRQSASKDLHLPTACEEAFTGQSQQVEKMLQDHLANYAEEERTLQVMLDEEQKETREIVQKKREQEHQHKLKKIYQETCDHLFGDEVIWDVDPLFPYYKYYTRAEISTETLAQVRRDWDRWAAPADSLDGSGVPVGWVVPVPPSSEAWASYLHAT